VSCITGYKYDRKIFSVNQQISIYYYYHIYYCKTRNLKVFLLPLSMMNIKNYYIDIDEIPWFPSWIKTIISLVKLLFLFHSRYISRHFVVDVIWRLSVWNVKIRRYLASCTLQFSSNLTKIIFQGKHFNYFIVGGWVAPCFLKRCTLSYILRYTRNIVQLNSFYNYIKFDSKHFFLSI
jgi:hypothetical protein